MCQYSVITIVCSSRNLQAAPILALIHTECTFFMLENFLGFQLSGCQRGSILANTGSKLGAWQKKCSSFKKLQGNLQILLWFKMCSRNRYKSQSEEFWSQTRGKQYSCLPSVKASYSFLDHEADCLKGTLWNCFFFWEKTALSELPASKSLRLIYHLDQVVFSS